MHGGSTAAAGAGRRLGLAAYDLQHDELAGGELIGQCHDRLLVVTDQHAEHVHSGVNSRHRHPVSHSPHPDGVVT